MLKRLIFFIGLTLALTSFGQNFTNTVNEVLTKKTNLNFHNGPDNQGDITGPISVFLDFAGPTPLSLNVSLKHHEVETTVFSYSPLTDLNVPLGIKSPLVNYNITDFEGEDKGGDWQLRINGVVPSVNVLDWGIVSIPEPDPTILAIIGLLILAVGYNFSFSFDKR